MPLRVTWSTYLSWDPPPDLALTSRPCSDVHSFTVQLYMPSSGYVNNCDGGRSHTYCDYRQQ